MGSLSMTNNSKQLKIDRIHKTKIKSYFRYHHHHTHPAKKRHRNFMDCLRYLESEIDHPTLDHLDAWCKILDTINSLNSGQLERMYYYIKIV